MTTDKTVLVPARLLYSRKQGAVMLGDVSVSYMKRLEEAGVLHPKRLNRSSRRGQVFYTHDDLVAAADKAVDATKGDRASVTAPPHGKKSKSSTPSAKPSTPSPSRPSRSAQAAE